MLPEHLSFIAAPMVNQSDLPFRTLVRRHGATLAYTQMLMPDRILNDQQYFEHHLRDLTLDTNLGHPVVVQLCGDDVDTIVQAGRRLQGSCEGIDLNLGCPLEAAREGHYGAYLLGQKDWPLVQEIVSGMSHSFTVPTSVKIRLCQPVERTLDFAQGLEACGASWVTLHARTVSARRRRQGAADLSEVRRLKEGLRIPVISNGNVRVWGDIPQNLKFTGVDGVMVGETLLGNPCLFENKIPDPVDIALEYLDICREFPDTAPHSTIQTHIRHFIEFQCGRRPWFQKFRAALGRANSTEDLELLLRTRVERWRGRPPRGLDVDTRDEDTGCDAKAIENPLDDAMDLTLMLG
ncbi:FMN-linked oxidoreductase [Lyophyllum atratum]|nr:FMN-linked oxidoreductase [Lyophyllum atratum]